jgi:hypothetical protein
MATVNGKGNFVQHAVYQVVWTPLTANDVGSAEQLSRFPNKSVSFVGTFGGTVVLEGSDDGATWFTLVGYKPGSTTIVDVSTTANARFDLVNVPLHVRPNAGSGVSSVTVTLTARSFGH